MAIEGVKGEGGTLPNTGERMIPESALRQTFWEHIYRYRFACRYARGKRVLDVACGEGYGTAALVRAGAQCVTGVDVSAESCEHARQKYGVDVREGDAQNLPLPESSVDLIVSFETIEHLSRPIAFLDECRRVLVPNGLLVISTPNKPAYAMDCSRNEFHCSEMEEDEFVDLLRGRFRKIRLYGQSLQHASFWSIRSLAAHHSPWADTRGYWRAQQAFASHLHTPEVDDKYRDAVSTILGHDSLLTHVFNPFAVRPRSRLSYETPKYWIAVARS